MLDTALAMAAAVIGIAFAMSTLDRWLARRRPHEGAWTIAFALFAVAALFMAAGADAGWTQARFRGFYLFGAIIDVPVLALGTLLLLFQEARRRIAMYSVTLFCVFGAGVMVAAPFTGPVAPGVLPQGSAVFGVWPRVLAAVGSGLGATIIVGGAIYSAARVRKKRVVISNLLIAGGTLILGASGLFNSVFDQMTAFSVALALGVSVLFIGFLVATSAPRKIVVDLTSETVEPKNETPVAEVKSIKKYDFMTTSVTRLGKLKTRR